VRSKPEKAASVICSKPEGALVQGILDGAWLTLEGESGFMLVTSGSNKLLEKTSAEAATSVQEQPKAAASSLVSTSGTVETWRVIWKGGVNVRSEKEKTSSALCSKPEGALVRGILDGAWLTLEGEPGFMRVTSGKNILLEKTSVEAESPVLKQPKASEPSQPSTSSTVESWRVIWKGGVNVRSEKDKTSSALCSKPEGALVQGTLEGVWLTLEGEPGFMLVTSGKNILLEKTSLETDASTPIQPKAAAASEPSTSAAVETWRVIWKGGANVRSEQDKTSTLVCTKPEGSIVRGVIHGQWLSLDGEVGFMLMGNSNKKFLEKLED